MIGYFASPSFLDIFTYRLLKAVFHTHPYGRTILSEHYGLQPSRAVETYEAIIMSREESKLLECGEGQPAFLLKRSTWDQNELLIEYTTSVMPSQRSMFEITMYHDGVKIRRKSTMN